MSPFEYNHTLARLRERMHMSLTAAGALLALAATAVLVRMVFAAEGYGLAVTLVALSGVAAGIALGSAWYARFLRDEVYDEILMSRLRHVGGSDVARHAQKLVGEQRRRQMARAIGRVVETTTAGLPSPIPVNRPAVNASRARLEALAAALCSPERDVTPHGMVMVRRLITNGASSPLYYHDASGTDELERALDSIDRELWVQSPERSLALAA